jgi:hypothetical protein
VPARIRTQGRLLFMDRIIGLAPMLVNCAIGID